MYHANYYEACKIVVFKKETVINITIRLKVLVDIDNKICQNLSLENHESINDESLSQLIYFTILLDLKY